MKYIVVLISGSGTNLQKIIDDIKNGNIPDTQISLVIADRDCSGLERAEKNGINYQIIKRGKTFSSELKKIIPKNTDLIVLAGFLSILDQNFINSFQGKIINIHPSLLPKFGGKGMWGINVHKSVIDSKEKETGATVHYVTTEIDKGDILLQEKIQISEEDTYETLAKKVLWIEHSILPKSIIMALDLKKN